ncbi:hypothetical protein A2422_02400 [Candidatus Woesebacteria bacterium RIFOXYC1_FULL_31_51]|uniref:Ribosomal protein L11 methyltransferase n=1 Tax=Candidatus Woesebacteria bacterium GW2011_GWC2_31_9 TaxID=1618586 RepID=A0A0F9YXE2_9BACT|nr:MAG: Ribosomal protein L11 methyltransferase [Candidatus Woesebacteria bacterium GW2011_GWF1_31_35]KKP23518.1 MAG: Ribosomal protein L11 methyltransferase [Candidatus Woesebacteria bacterium GW2011_GWC1_30_29]KKP25696.1 MAG: Ribosomal protein L11 methyltransferase [Candidatus Woesebacteria bacterium GW2011_GWD1_31_12]KKP27794.1 MAG: Ribosomal protein L11 methyltransferase [Candidatus Woesebacteria bacterium GW2011_GWB1_31_29]KKP31116.1 MAG: Ribosomal protein L11 methyltransferase [Candidatus
MKFADITTPVRAKLIAKTYKDWIKPKDNVLDIGCGNGVVSLLLKKLLKINITGCDREKYLIRNITYKCMVNDSTLPFNNEVFNVSMFNDVLHHTSYKNQIGLILEALRVSKRVTIFELKPTIICKFLDFTLNKIHNPRMDIPFTYRSEIKWENLFKNNNISYKKKTVKSPIFYPFSHAAYLLTKTKTLLKS